MFLQQLINGLTLGSTYSLLAIGFTLVLGLLQMLNIAHGDVFMIGAFLGLTFSLLGMPLYLALILAMIGAGLLAVIIERLCFRPLRKAHFLMPLLSTIAFGILLQNVATQMWGSEPSRYPQTMEIAQFHLGSVQISSIDIIILVVSLGFMIGIDLFVRKTRFGRAMRATSEKPQTASILGVDVNMVIIVTFFASGALAGIAGVLTALVYLQITPFIGIRQGLIGMVAMVIGGVGSLRGAMIGGLMIGIIEIMNDAYFTASYRDIILFGLFFVFIVFKPEGLFGAKER
ncbi:MAG: branched-chain amino acid ABC transporter permease [Desulfobacteraceae bacterium]|uniref:Branched-chain amino acid ABC transporter permease n=1 Tax=Candidatus Desulfacyla euxinica TaxID=2841693 RepID=A0A8J6N3C2_9DELT|nr:branched-chain amino acid ABC transporter permease [Candidatus Desulfacyla euxinica]MBL6977518.1 branched-chain amino acid ABC transporter permease [Desulfobacteraceae bacterium]MBL7216171.1 branched-chain amino acid ABC transporter permease [Desulfobacteraceae bacterium]